MSRLSGFEAAFRRFSAASARALGSSRSVGIHLMLAGAWLATGPHFGWSDAWQLSANTPISIETLIVGLLVLASSNRDAALIQAKLDELMRAGHANHQELIGAQNRPDDPVGE